MAEPFDLAVLGGGPAGYVAALRAAQLGARCMLFEKQSVGGTCLNRGCIPTKALIRSAEVLLELREAASYGVTIGGPVSADWQRMVTRKGEVVRTLVSGVESLLASGKVNLIRHEATLSARSDGGWQIGAGDETHVARKAIIATGSVPARLPVPGNDLPGVITSTEALNLERIPSELVIAGGNVIGLEFACLFWALGSRVTVLEMLPGILPATDERFSARLLSIMRARGVTILLGAKVAAIESAAPGLRVRYETPQGESAVTGDTVLLATGQRPYTEGLGLQELGIAMNRRAIAVNDRLEASLPGLYAAGDCVGGQMLAHVASHHGIVAAENALGARRAIDLGTVPACIFTLPEIAGVGLTEKQAKEKGIATAVGRFPFAALGRAIALGETEGQVRLICEASSGTVLGMHVMGPHASDLIAEGALAVRLGLTARQLADTIHAHPTLPEAVAEAALGVYGEAIHQRKI